MSRILTFILVLCGAASCPAYADASSLTLINGDHIVIQDALDLHNANIDIGECLENAFDQKNNLLADGPYELQDGQTGVVQKTCWSILEQGGILENGDLVYTATFTDDGESPFILRDKTFVPLTDGPYLLKNDRAHLQRNFTVTNGVIDDYGGFDGDGRFGLENRD